VSHGNLSVVINADNSVSQPGAMATTGQTAANTNADVSITAAPGKVMYLQGGASLSDVVKALNVIGATPQDLVAILQAMKAAGSLRAELEII
jgi:flagellar P-ring protein FlgI